ncbi:HAMP domain-containing histidine kinase [Psychrobium sp. MM17-31]|uniref:sensor histidine kinase n=1 Tax=Psychrobium sp. MM17-31 TaxID=2917758 RepID=UPI001EF5DB50|nr:HAMP domain-containing sensor histidine kinase [Psychrobium sp. MM17-31]MCG7532739.1 HAMP domain-containing histidine kinase [Psychrobium sp. MM17-31]
MLFTPACLISLAAYTQFAQEQLTQYQQQSDKMSAAINKRLFKRRTLPNTIRYSEFSYIQHIYNPQTKQLTQELSPLADPQYYQHADGLVGYFQIDPDVGFSSPTWPFVIDSPEDQQAITASTNASSKAQREKIATLQRIVSSSSKVTQLSESGAMKEKELFQLVTDVPDYFIFYRIIKMNERLVMQGYVVDKHAFVSPAIIDTMNIAQFDKPMSILVQDIQQNQGAYLFSRRNQQSDIEITLLTSTAEMAQQQLIKRAKLNYPYTDFQLSYITSQLAPSANANYGLALMAVLLITIIFGCFGFYRIGAQQLALAEQRLNFVSSVSHELKTPLTSIRMYAEMLSMGAVLSKEHQAEYYEFIQSESERLSRLIDNILQLATLNQPERSINLQYVKAPILADTIRSKLSSLLDNNQFELVISPLTDKLKTTDVLVDSDAFSQVIINIADNAVKFFDREKINDKSRQRLDFNFSLIADNQLQLEIRDYGDGISAEQQQKIFELFYRGGSELTRTTQGTGIGLALVNELMAAQQGSIQVKRMTPGLAMIISFNVKTHQM